MLYEKPPVLLQLLQLLIEKYTRKRAQRMAGTKARNLNETPISTYRNADLTMNF